MKILLAPFQFLYGIWVAVSYFLTLSLVFPFIYFIYLIRDDYNGHRNALELIRFWSALWGFLCGFRFEVRDKKVLDGVDPVVFVCNHASNLDANLWGYASAKVVKGLAKKELMKVPLMGYIFRKTCVIVDRGDKGSRKDSIIQLRKATEKGFSIFFFPEGTRNRSDKPLLPFYDGAFRIAIELQLPIAPVVMCNTRTLVPVGSFRFKPGKSICIFLEPIPTKGLTQDDMPDLKQRIFALMEKAVIENDVRFEGSKMASANQPLQ